MVARPPLPPFDEVSAQRKVQAVEDAWNTREPERVALACTSACAWRDRDEFITGRNVVIDFLALKWKKELDYALRADLWNFRGNRIAVRFQYEWNDEAGRTWRSYGNEMWEFDGHGLMSRREASLNDVEIHSEGRRIHGPRPDSEHGRTIPLH
ncbi:DUF1348 family protein [Allosalinactinospora lopnorensis]|uniref:DUF1348 family protein n=1 Tax=Allosalinactinospora lopnorensis TaxID=1352348 RepID=UPI000623E10D|nr:DUF1348 family protein [Allosalinactinospora lopnorensis]